MAEKLSFYTTGEGFTNLLKSFFEEGRFKALYEVLEEGGLPFEQIKIFFLGMGYFTGDTRNDGTLDFCLRDCENVIEHRIYWALKNAASNVKKTNQYKFEEDEEEWESNSPLTLLELLEEEVWDKDENIQFLCKVFNREQIIKWILPHVMSDEGYETNPDPSLHHGNGVIVKTGDFVTCRYMEHQCLYPILYTLGVVDSPQWMDDNTAIHISSGQASGTLVHELEREPGSRGMTKEQLMALIKYKKSVEKIYSKWEKLFETIRKFIGELEDKGGKYNNLSFLKLAYPKLNLPKFSLEPIPDVKQCIRTSPKYSLPGLLESKFNLNDNSIKEIEETFEKYKDIKQGNELHYFYQEFIEGTNGVCHINRSGFTYAVGDEQGDVVAGKISGKILPKKQEVRLQNIAKELFDDMGVPLQIEFVAQDGGKIYLVQLRKIENECERTVIGQTPTGILVAGKTFSKGEIENLTINDVLIVDNDAKSEELLGKKALIVKNNVEFSHILALASSLRIPALYATGDFVLPATFSIKAFNEKGYIHK